MTVAIQNYPKFKYTIASTGQPGAGYKLFTYEEGTSTKKTTWTSLSKSAENTNPIVLDANGEADVWMDGDYKFVLAPPTDTDPPTSPIWTVDAIRSEDIVEASTIETAPINGSFETDTNADGVPDNWTIVELSGGTVAIDAAASSHGLNSLKFTSTGSGAGSASTDEYYRVEAGKVVGVKFSLISDDADTLNKVQIYWYNSTKTYLSTSDAYNDGATNPTSWTRKYPTATAPATAKYARIILIGVDAASTTHSNTWFDNIEFDASFTGELPTDLKDVTSTATELNKLDGATVSTAELNHSVGVTSAIQTQLDVTPTETSVGRIELATQAEVDAGTDTVRAVVPTTLAGSVQVAKAWVNFNGVGTVAIRDSFNVSSLTDSGTGDYSINFTTAFADVNYAALVSVGGGTSDGAIMIHTVSTTNVRVIVKNFGSSYTDKSIITMSAFS